MAAMAGADLAGSESDEAGAGDGGLSAGRGAGAGGAGAPYTRYDDDDDLADEDDDLGGLGRGDADGMADGLLTGRDPNDVVPTGVRDLRACLVCSMVKVCARGAALPLVCSHRSLALPVCAADLRPV